MNWRVQLLLSSSHLLSHWNLGSMMQSFPQFFPPKETNFYQKLFLVFICYYLIYIFLKTVFGSNKLYLWLIFGLLTTSFQSLNSVWCFSKGKNSQNRSRKILYIYGNVKIVGLYWWSFPEWMPGVERTVPHWGLKGKWEMSKLARVIKDVWLKRDRDC